MRQAIMLVAAGVFVTVALFSPAQAEEKKTLRGVDLSSMKGWDIVVSEGAIPSDVYAAEEFRRYFAEGSEIRLPIVRTAGRTDHHVFIGPSKAMRTSTAGFDVGKFGPEDLRIVVRGGNIAIAGGRPRGTLYGVYTFLEKCLGVRFLTFDHTHVPKITSRSVLGQVDYFYHPPFVFRMTSFSATRGNSAFSAKARNNGFFTDPDRPLPDATLGGKSGLKLVVHGLASRMPSEKYGKKHPEYYCEIDGKRLADVKNDQMGNQACLTNPDVLRIATASALRELAEHPDLENVDVSQNDNDKYCRCAKCSAIDQREGTPMGTILQFANAVADEVAKKHPGVLVGTLSYWYSQTPPKTIKARSNVQVQLCSMEACLIHAINDPACPRNAAFCRDMERWGKICDNVFIWHYATNFTAYHLPCPNLLTMGGNIKHFAASNVKGVFVQTSTEVGGEFSDLRSYILSNLLWDPTGDPEKLMEEFLHLHYGRASAPIRWFIDLVHARAVASGLHRRCWGRAKDYGLDDESLAAAGLKAFAEAMKLADNKAVRSRVEKASLVAYRLAIEPVWFLEKKEQLNPVLAKRMRPLVRRFFELGRKYDAEYVAHPPSDLEGATKRLKRVFGLQESEEF